MITSFFGIQTLGYIQGIYENFTWILEEMSQIKQKFNQNLRKVYEYFGLLIFR